MSKSKATHTEHSYILSIETSSNTCGIVVSDLGTILLEYSININQLHDKLLADYVRRAMEDLEITPDSFSALALSTGPGSFTGLRIGTAFAMGFLFSSDIKFIKVPTLESLAAATKEYAIHQKSGSILTYLKSHKDLYFYQVFSTELLPQSEIEVVTEEELIEIINSKNIPVAGNGTFFPDNSLSGLNKLSPRFVALRASQKFINNEFDDINKFEPLYHLDFTPKTKEKNG